MTHLYATRSRPAMYGTVPPGFTVVSEEQTDLTPFGTISYETQLDALTCWKYELRNLFKDYKVGDKVSWVEGGKVFTCQIYMIDEEGTMWADQYTPLPPYWNLHLTPSADEQRSYDLKRPSHLIAGQVIRDIEALQMVADSVKVYTGFASEGPEMELIAKLDNEVQS